VIAKVVGPEEESTTTIKSPVAIFVIDVVESSVIFLKVAEYPTKLVHNKTAKINFFIPTPILI